MAGIILIIHLIEWVDKNCRARYAAVTAGAVTTLISLGGNLLSVKGRGYITTSILEGIFIFAVVSLGCRVLHMLLHGKEIMEIAKEEDRKEQRLLNYAESFNGLSEAFVKMSAGQEKASEEEIGQVQNELTGKSVCPVTCARSVGKKTVRSTVCWQSDGVDRKIRKSRKRI